MRLGLDIAFSHLGCVAVEDKNVVAAKAITTQKGKAKYVAYDDARRCVELAQGLIEFIKEHKPTEAYAELPIGSQDARAAKALGMAMGIALTVVTMLGLPITYVVPSEVKKAVGGNNKSDKDFVKNVVKRIFNWPKRGFNEHTADASAAILAGLNKRGLGIA